MNQAKRTGRVSDTSVTPMRRHPRTVTTADVRDARTALRRAQVRAQVRAMELPAALGAPHRQRPGEDITVIIGRTAPCAAAAAGGNRGFDKSDQLAEGVSLAGRADAGQLAPTRGPANRGAAGPAQVGTGASGTAKIAAVGAGGFGRGSHGGLLRRDGIGAG